MIVAVTGASGFIGGHIARALLERGHEVHSFGTRPATALTSPLPRYTSWRIESGKIPAPHVDVVVHCAALVGDWGPEHAYHAVNVTGTQTVLDTFPDARIVYVSSSSVYSDRQSTSLLDESCPVGDCRYSAYGRTKALAEPLVLARNASVVLRPHIVYGPDDTTLLPRVIASRRAGRLLVPGDGENMLSVTHVLNLTNAVVASVERADVCGVFNVADATTATLNELLVTLLARAGAASELVHIPGRLAWAAATVSEWLYPFRTPPRGPRITRYIVHQMTSSHTLNIEKARHQLGYDPQLNFRSS